MAGVTAIGYANQFKLGTVTATSSVINLGPTNLSSDQCSPSSGWQTANGVRTASAGAVIRVTATATYRAFAFVNTNLTLSAAITAGVYRAGGAQVASLAVLRGPQTGYRQVIGVFDADASGDYIEFQFEDSNNPDNHINIGGAFAGAMWFPSRGVSWDSSYGATTRFRSVVTDGGQEYRAQRSRQRKYSLSLDAVSDAEAWDDMGELDRISAIGGNVLFIPDATSVDISREAVFGVVDTLADVSYPARAVDTRAWRAQITERL